MRVVLEHQRLHRLLADERTAGADLEVDPGLAEWARVGALLRVELAPGPISE